MRQAELGLVRGHGGEPLHQLREVMPDAPDDLGHDADVSTLDAARVIDAGGELGVRNTQSDTLAFLKLKMD